MEDNLKQKFEQQNNRGTQERKINQFGNAKLNNLPRGGNAAKGSINSKIA